MNLKKQNVLGVPVLIWMFTLVGIPLILVFFLSFMSRDSLGNIVYTFTLNNYKKILSPTYLKIFMDSFKLALSTASLTLIIGYPVAYISANLSPKKKRLALLLVMIPFWTSSLMRTYGWVILLGRSGLINTFLLNLNLIQRPIDMMYKFTTVLIGTTYMLVPFMIISIFNSVDKLDKTLLEASYDLGAGKIKTFLNITLPLTLAGIARGFTLVFIPSLGLYFISDLLGGGQKIFLGNLINNQVTRGRNRPEAAALAMVMILMVLFVLFIYSKINKKFKGEGAYYE